MSEEYFNADEILNLGWEEEEKNVIERILTHFKTWKRWIPKNLENDIKFVIQLAIREKTKINELTKHL